MIATELDSLVERWLVDLAFRADLRSDVEGALSRAGFRLTDEELAALKRVPWDLSDAELMARTRSSIPIDKFW